MMFPAILLIPTMLFLMGQADENAGTRLEVPTQRVFARAAVVDHKIFRFGGGSAYLEVFDTRQRKWSRMKTKLSGVQVFGDQIDGKLYLLDVATREFHQLDPTTKKIKELANAPTRRMNGTVVAAGGKLYVMGGYSPDVNEKNCVEVYDPKTSRWSVGPPLPGYKKLDHFHSATVVNGKLHVVGGMLSGEGQPHWRLGDGGRWERRAEPPMLSLWKHSVVATVAGKIYLIVPPVIARSSAESEEAPQHIFIYDSKADRWTSAGHAPDDLSLGLFAQAVVEEKIYVMGGMQSKDVRIFNTKTKRWK